MFERYTEKARRVIFFARYEASQFGSPCIETEHLLLGLLREDKALTYRFLRSYGSVESIRREIEGHTTIRNKVSTSVDMPLSNECTRVLAYAAEEAERLSHKFIGTEHLFLGLLREQDCFAAQLLNGRGVSIDTARGQIASEPAPQLGSPPRSPGVPAGYISQKLLYNPASETVIAELRAPGGANVLPTRLFIRRKDAEAYEQIGNPPEELSYESSVTCDKQPVVVFNSSRWDEAKTRENWAGVYSFNLNTKELAVCISPETLRFPEPHGRMWILELVFLSDDARKLYVNVGIEKAVSGGVVDYYLASVDLTDQQLELVCPLKDIRF
jgi:Clp amino terminal domain, pathogenicity island component